MGYPMTTTVRVPRSNPYNDDPRLIRLLCGHFPLRTSWALPLEWPGQCPPRWVHGAPAWVRRVYDSATPTPIPVVKSLQMFRRGRSLNAACLSGVVCVWDDHTLDWTLSSWMSTQPTCLLLSLAHSACVLGPGLDWVRNMWRLLRVLRSSLFYLTRVSTDSDDSLFDVPSPIPR